MWRCVVLLLCFGLAFGMASELHADDAAQDAVVEGEQQDYLDMLGALRERVEHLEAEREHPLSVQWRNGLSIEGEDYRLWLGGWIQPRYEYTREPGDEDKSSFLLRRVRLDFQGFAFDERITFRVMSEFARTANLRDAWINYRFDPALQVRAGQFTVPFQWHRYVSPRRQHFAERGVPSETFGFPTGRDVGAMAHGRLADGKLAYGLGVLDGAGRNVATSNSSGNMASARATWAVLGDLPREESDLAFSEDLQWALGGGVQGARKNEARAWDLGRSATGNDRADWAAGTADTLLRYRGFSLAGDAYFRSVDPDDTAVSSYRGWAYMVSGGYFVVPEKYEVVGRWSQLRLDRGENDTRHDQWGLGANWYIHGHDHKLRLNYFNNKTEPGTDQTLLLEYHLQF